MTDAIRVRAYTLCIYDVPEKRERMVGEHKINRINNDAELFQPDEDGTNVLDVLFRARERD